MSFHPTLQVSSIIFTETSWLIMVFGNFQPLLLPPSAFKSLFPFDTSSLVYTCIQVSGPFHRFSDQTKIEPFVLCVMFEEPHTAHHLTKTILMVKPDQDSIMLCENFQW